MKEISLKIEEQEGTKMGSIKYLVDIVNDWEFRFSNKLIPTVEYREKGSTGFWRDIVILDDGCNNLEEYYQKNDDCFVLYETKQERKGNYQGEYLFEWLNTEASALMWKILKHLTRLLNIYINDDENNAKEFNIKVSS